MKEIRNHHMPIFRIPRKAFLGIDPIDPTGRYGVKPVETLDPNSGYRTPEQMTQDAQNQPLPTPSFSPPPIPPQGFNDKFKEASKPIQIPGQVIGQVGQQMAMSTPIPNVGLAAGSGAISGFSAGAKFGPWGAAAGAAIGGLSGFAKGAAAKGNALDANREKERQLYAGKTVEGTDLGNFKHGGQVGGSWSPGHFNNLGKKLKRSADYKLSTPEGYQAKKHLAGILNDSSYDDPKITSTQLAIMEDMMGATSYEFSKKEKRAFKKLKNKRYGGMVIPYGYGGYIPKG